MASEGIANVATAAAPAEVTVEDKPFTLFIPHLHEKTSEQKVFAVFRNLGLGRLGAPDGGEAIVLTERKDREDRPYKTAQVHFQHLFARGKNGAQNVNIYKHLKEHRDNFFTVEHMSEKVKEDGTVLPARYWKPRLDRPFRKTGDGGAVRSAMTFGKLERKPKVQMLATDEDWGDDVKHEPGATADEAAAVAREESATEEAEAEGDEATGETMTDEEYAAQVLAGGSA